ncbi:RNA polymerase sigma-70 factor [Sinomicrobium kalidii]|uniref:RNA polymerase sigma factor n=1 Tax=Sinomicrobium kalidii TaxID=2900738 RepID=UPI001E5D15A0|nr:RNA polymerase sigma-70 factor [Sinomicrobium kalidii]UGU15312.1 RNA polymerase sigma-70 factor [Sinomicrobium kalidii]
MEDVQLAQAIRDGQEPAFRQLFERYYQRLHAYITSFTRDRDEAEDIVQQAFMVLWSKRRKLDTGKSLKSYLYTIAHNIYIDQHRQLKRRNAFFDELKAAALRERIKEDEDLVEQRIQKLKSIVESLPPRCREILQLNKLEGLKYREIAGRLDISLKTVEAQMRIAFRKIRKGLSDDEFLLFVLARGLPEKV